MLDECTEGIVLQQSNLVDSTVTLHLHLVVRNKRWNSLQVEQEAERTKKMLARFLKNCDCVWHDQFPYRVMGCEVGGVAPTPPPPPPNGSKFSG